MTKIARMPNDAISKKQLAFRIGCIALLCFADNGKAQLQSIQPRAAETATQKQVLDPLFNLPAAASFDGLTSLVGENTHLNGNKEISDSVLSENAATIRKTFDELKSNPAKSEGHIEVSERYIENLQVQAQAFERMRVIGATSALYPDLRAALRDIRRRQAQRYYELILSHPKHPNSRKWTFGKIMSRLRMGDPSVRQEALDFLKDANQQQAREIERVAVAMDAAANRIPSPFGTIERILENGQDPLETAAFNLLKSDLLARSGKSEEATMLLKDALATFSSLKYLRKEPNSERPSLLIRYTAMKLTDIALRNPSLINDELVKTLVTADLPDIAVGYLEKCALATYRTNLQHALKGYAEIVAIGDLNDEQKLAVEQRMLQLTVNSQNTDLMIPAWQRIIKLGIHKAPQFETQLNASIQILMQQYLASPSAATVQRLVSLHDLLSKNFPSYAAREDHQLRVLNALYDTKQFPEVVLRGDALLASINSRFGKITAYNLNLKARLQLMGLNPDMPLAAESKIGANGELAPNYIAYTEKLIELLPKFEAQPYYHKAAQVQMLFGQQKEALVRFEEAFTKAPHHPTAPQSATFLLSKLYEKNDIYEIEKFIRIFIKNSVVPSQERFRKLRALLEKTHFQVADLLLKEQRFEEAGLKFSTFSKEFPASPAAADALERSGFAYSQAQKNDLAIESLKLFLTAHTKHPSVMEVSWMLAGLYYSSKEFANAADGYIAFRSAFPREALMRKASLKAAESLRFAGKPVEAMRELEIHFNEITTPSEKTKILKLIAEIAGEAGNDAVQLNASARMLKLESDPDTLAGIHFGMLMLYRKSGQTNMVRTSANAILELNTQTAEGRKTKALAKFVTTRADILKLRATQINPLKDMKSEIEAVLKDYENAKTSLLAPCDAPATDWCPLANFEVSRLAHQLSKALANSNPPKSVSNEVAEELISMRDWNADKLKADAQNYGNQAGDLLPMAKGLSSEETEAIKTHLKILSESSDSTLPPPAGNAKPMIDGI